jgi:hypothetical protein
VEGFVIHGLLILNNNQKDFFKIASFSLDNLVR